MKLRPEALSAQLGKGLAPIYYISGDEPFQLGEACDQIRKVAQLQGFEDRQVMHAERGFDWQQLLHETESLSLFAQRKLIELRLGSSKPGAEGGAVLQSYCEHVPADTVLLLVGDKLEPAQQKSKWFTAVEQCGVVVQVWPLEANRLPAWLSQRMSQRGLQASTQAIAFLADQVQGNLLAADQEIEKLSLLYPAGKLDIEQLQRAVADSARFDIFSLVDEAIAGHAQRVSRMLYGLRAEGNDPVLILWALTREIRTLAQISHAMQRGQSAEQALQQQYVWDKRKPLFRAAVQRNRQHWSELLIRCARIDRVIKGRSVGAVWDELLELALNMAGQPVLKTG